MAGREKWVLSGTGKPETAHRYRPRRCYAGGSDDDRARRGIIEPAGVARLEGYATAAA